MPSSSSIVGFVLLTTVGRTISAQLVEEGAGSDAAGSACGETMMLQRQVVQHPAGAQMIQAGEANPSHDASKCEEYGHPVAGEWSSDDDCCAIKPNARCTDGYEITWRSTSCASGSWGTADDYTCTAPTTQPTQMTCEDVWNTAAVGPNGDWTCGERITYLKSKGSSDSESREQIVSEFPDTCGPCMPNPGSSPVTPAPPNPTDGSLVLKAMSYNTQYTGYSDGRDWDYANLIKSVGPGVVGTQECQDKSGLSAKMGYSLVPDTDFQNPIFYNPSKVSYVDGSGGWMSIPRDNYSPRTITWARFRLSSSEFMFFNTHLPHNHGEASSTNTHSRIARQLLDKRAELGAGNVPTVIVGDCNSFASSGASEGSFQSNLEDNGFFTAYVVHEGPGHHGLDKIFASSHWTAANRKNEGTGRSDHPAITVDLTLVDAGSR